MSSNGNPVVEFRSVQYRVNDRAIIDNLNLQISRGETLVPLYFVRISNERDFVFWACEFPRLSTLEWHHVRKFVRQIFPSQRDKTTLL